jgi:flagellum-specific peptidoglycan hydrolase FlgJ
VVSVHSARKPWWQQATALVTVSTGGVITGFSFVPGAAATMTSPTSMPLHLLALQRAASGTADASGTAAHGDAALRAAIVNVASYYLRLAKTSTPAQMEALIWDKDSLDGADHGPSCAAFASLTLELAAQAVGKQSWVTGGTTYPWPLHEWADVRVEPNPDSLDITSIQQDAQAHGRWHPLGDGYQPQPGDWVLFNGHVEVVTSYANGVLDSIGADSLPNLTVNAHSFGGPFAGQGVVGFVDNGHLASQASTGAAPTLVQPAHENGPARQGLAHIPGDSVDSAATIAAPAGTGHAARGTAAIPGAIAPSGLATTAPGATGAAGKPPKPAGTAPGPASSRPAPAQSKAPSPASAPETRAQQAFISQIAPGAIAAQQRYGVPASVTIAQAIDESDWGRSGLAVQDHNLFGIKGTGPAGSVALPTQEYVDGQWETVTASFRVYHNIAESISDHAELLATDSVYSRAMADRAVPDAFANDLTGVYATDPEYGANLIALMRLYNLYRFDPPGTGQPKAASGTQAATGPAAAASHAPGSADIPGGEPAWWSTPGKAPPGGGAAIPGAVIIPGPVAFPGTVASARSVTVRGPARIPGLVAPALPKYQAKLPATVATAYFATAKAPLARGELLYRDVAAQTGIRWQLLAACDWMQCQADPRYSPVHGERLGTLNADYTVYETKSEALVQCATDLVELSAAVYGIDLTGRRPLSVRALADAFAAFRWGAILRRHGVSAMEFPYSVAGLTAQHLKMHWPAVNDPDAPDKPGGRFRMPFGAVPVVLTLRYQATV